MLKLFVQSNYSATNMKFITLDIENIEDFKDSPRVNYGFDVPKFESPCMVVRKSYT